MTVELGVLGKGWWQYWPCGVAGGFVPTCGILLGRWMPPHVGWGVAALIAWSFVILVLGKRHPPKYGLPVWLAAILTGLAAGLATGVLAYFLPLE